MGEIADALRRADPLDPSRTQRKHEHDSEPEYGLPLRPPSPASPVDVQSPPARREREPVQHSVRRLLEVEDGIEQSQPARICLDDPQSHSAQQYRRLAIRLRNMATSRHARSIVITSAQAGDGKTTTACNLAVALAMTDENSRVVLADLDLHRAGIASSLGIKIDIPIDAILRGEFTFEQGLIETDVEGFHILAANSSTKRPEQLLARHELASLIANLKSRFDWVIIYTPPVLATSDAQVILQHADAALLVVRAGISPVRAIRRSLDHLPTGKALASFLNSSESKSQHHDYYDDDYQGSHERELFASDDNSENQGGLDVKRAQ